MSCRRAALLSLALLLPLGIGPAFAVEDVIKETVQRYLDRFAHCRDGGIETITVCFEGWVDKKVADVMVTCIGKDRVPASVTDKQRSCIWIDVSTEEEADFF